MNPNVVSFLYGVALAFLLFRILSLAGKSGYAHGECPFCNTVVDVHYDEMYECPNCKRRYTNEEAREQESLNQQEEEREREYQERKLFEEYRKEEYKEKLNDLNDEYRDVKGH